MLALLAVLALAGGGGADEPGVLAYTRSDQREGQQQQVWRMRADGGERVLLARNAREPAWSADGRLVAFVRDGAIWIMDAGGADQRRLTTGGAVGDSGPSWAPDGRSLAFTRGGGGSQPAIWVMSADGSAAHTIVEGGANAAWSPDGQVIAFSRASLGRRGELLEAAIYTVRTDGSDLRRLSANGSLEFGPSWSPDGRRIAYFSYSDRNGRTCGETCFPHSEIYVMRAGGGGTTRLTRTRATEGRPEWSDDGSTIVFDQYPLAHGEPSRVVALAIESGCTASLRVASDTSESFRNLAWQPGSGTARLPCDPPLPPARATFVGVAPSAVPTRIRGGRAGERALLRRLIAGLGGGTRIKSVRIGRPPAGRRARSKPSPIWLRFQLSGRGGRNSASAVRPTWEAGLVADAYQRASASGLAPRPLLGHTLSFERGATSTSTQARRRRGAPPPNEPLPVSLIASELAAASLPTGVRVETVRFLRHHDQSAVRLVLRVTDPTSFATFTALNDATLGRLQLDQGGLVEFRDRCGRLVAAIATGVDGAPGRLGVARGWVCQLRLDGDRNETTCPTRKPPLAC